MSRPPPEIPNSNPKPQKRKGSSGVTIGEVARVAGVSMITVSRVMNTPEQVSPATLEKVRGAVTKLGYVPNLMAGGLRSSRSRLVVAMVPTVSSQLFSRAIQSLTRELESQGYQLMLGQSGYSDSREDKLLDAIIGRRPDGIVLTGIMHSIEGRRRLLASGIPVVETWDYTPTPIDMLVGFSHEQVGHAVCDFLAKKGRQRLALVTANDARAMSRKAGFLRRARELGLEEPVLHTMDAPGTHSSGRQGLADILHRQPKTDAVFCSSDLVAMGVLDESRARAVEVPGKLAVMGFGDLEFSASLNPSLSSVRIDGEALGRQSAKFIVDRAEGRPIAQRAVDLGFDIIERDSA